MKIKKFKKLGKVLTSKEQKTIKGGRGCSCHGNNMATNSSMPMCHEC